MTGSPSGAPELQIEFPPKPEYVRTIRHAIGALGRLHELPEGMVDDLKLAVSEACTSAILGAQGGDPIGSTNLTLTATIDDGTLAVEILDIASGLERAVQGPPTELDTGDLPFEPSLSLPVIRGLVDDLAITPHEAGGATIRMSVSLR